jgi:hypothetical protein
MHLSKREKERLAQNDYPRNTTGKQPRAITTATATSVLPTRKHCAQDSPSATSNTASTRETSSRSVKRPVNYFPPGAETAGEGEDEDEVEVEVEVHNPHPQTSRPKKERTNFPGLREFSLMVCAKVHEKQRTTYNEVADELVSDLGHNFGKSLLCAACCLLTNFHLPHSVICKGYRRGEKAQT